MEKGVKRFLLMVAMISVFFVLYAISTQADCWNYYTQADCNAAPATETCTWRTSTWSMCEGVTCWSFEGTNQTACESNSYGLSCQWSTGCMGGPNCWSPQTEAACEAVAGCSWGSCSEKGCWYYTNSNDCGSASGCSWDTNGNYCKYTSCYDNQNSTACAADSDCYWSTSSSSCYEKMCSNYNYNQSACSNSTVTGRNCKWSSPYCNEGGCMTYYTQNACEGATGINCTWRTSSSGWCEKTQCWSFDYTNQATCEDATGIDCTWNEPWCDINMSAVNCPSYTTETGCYDSFYCWWDYTNQQCNEPMGGGKGDFVGGFMMEEWNPGCYIFDINTSYCYNVSGCTHNGSNCLSNATIQETGIKCEYINDSTVCNNIPILSKCCKWSGGSCITDNFTTDCWDNMKAPPTGASFCEDYTAYTSQIYCEQIANYPWFMPCKWDNTSQQCKFKAQDAFGTGSTGGFEELSSKKNCEYAGGQWIEETYCVNTTAIPAGWCEMKFGAGGGKTCDTQCWACEFKNDGSVPASATAAQDRCLSSTLGSCEWRTDSNAPNTYGYCELKQVFKFGATDCDTDCWACEKKGNWVSSATNTPKYHCENSLNGCKWEQDLSTTDTTKGWCMPATDKTCAEECYKCYDQAACVNYGKGGSNACTWNSNTNVCTVAGGGTTELCFDGINNDADNDIDCADKDCMYDPFCGGGMMGNSCSQYTDEAICGSSGCSWMLTTLSTGYCGEQGQNCMKLDGNETGCNATTGCSWTSGRGMCEVNHTKYQPCRMLGENDCKGNSECEWFADPYCVANPGVCSGGWCESKMESCSMNMSKQSSSTVCNDDNCMWEEMVFFSGGDLGMMSSGGHCKPRCFNSSLSTSELCNGVDGCKYIDGYCNPMGMGTMTGGGMMMGGTCWQYDNNKTGCIGLTECSWMPNPQPFCDSNRTTDCAQNSFSQESCDSQAGCKWTGSWCDSAAYECMWNTSLMNNETNCKANTNCTWIASASRCDNVCFNQAHTACTNSSLEPICIWKEGFCGGAMMGSMFMNMEAGPPIMLGSDTCPETGMLNALDICNLGVKEMKGTYMFGATTQSFKDSAVCNGKYTTSGMGGGQNATMFYVYLDTDSRETGGCNSSSSTVADKVGYEFMFKYEVTWDTTNGQASETKTAYKCSSGSWTATDIKISVMAEKMCNEINGPMVGISKDDITKLTSLFNMTKPIRVYATTANSSANRANPIDTIGPLYYSAGSADAKFENCMLKGADIDGDGLTSDEDPDCTWLTQYGYIKSEDCYSPRDDDGDGLFNCSDPDCKCEESDCADIPICANIGVNIAGYVDNTAPKILYYKVDPYVDAAAVYYDTDEVANGTVLFYENDTSCTALNTTVNDVGVWHTGVKKFKGWHEAPLENDAGAHSLDHALRNATTYYFKMKVCDKSGNCLTSACMNFTTAGTLGNCPGCDFIFKLEVPTGWKVHMDFDQDGAYEVVQGDMCGAGAGTLVNYTRGRNVSILLNNTADNTGLYFYGIRLSKGGYNYKIKTMNETGTLKTGSTSAAAGGTAGYAGMNSDTRDKIINKLHPQICRVKIPGSGSCSALWHCDDNLTHCSDMTAQATWIETGTNYCIWEVPYCEFSTWSGGQPGTAAAAAAASSSTTGGGSAGSLGASRGLNPSVTYIYDKLTADKEETLNIDEEGLYLTKVAFISKNDVEANIEVHVEAIPEDQLEIQKLSTPVYQYVQIKKSGITDADVKGVTIHFRVLKSWLEENNIGKEKVYLMVYNGETWEKAALTTLETSDSITGAVVGTSGGSSLRKLWSWITFPFRWLKGAITGYAVYSPGDYEYYVAKMGIMNYVAITGETSVIEGLPEEEAVSEEAKAAEERALAAAEALEEKPEAKTPWLAYVLVVAVIIIAIAVYLGKKKYFMPGKRLESEIKSIEKKLGKK